MGWKELKAPPSAKLQKVAFKVLLNLFLLYGLPVGTSSSEQGVETQETTAVAEFLGLPWHVLLLPCERTPPLSLPLALRRAHRLHGSSAPNCTMQSKCKEGRAAASHPTPMFELIRVIFKYLKH